MILAIVGENYLADLWWNSSNRAFDGETPEEVLNKDPERVIRYIKAMFIR